MNINTRKHISLDKQYSKLKKERDTHDNLYCTRHAPLVDNKNDDVLEQMQKSLDNEDTFMSLLENNNIDIFKLMCNNNNINNDDLLGNNCLLYIAKHNIIDKLEYLLSLKTIDLYKTNKMGENILSILIYNCNISVLKMVLGHMKDTNIVRCMLEVAKLNDNSDDNFIIELLKIYDEYNCDFDIFNNIYNNLLINTIVTKNMNLFETLLKYPKIDVNLCNGKQIPLFVAIKKIVELEYEYERIIYTEEIQYFLKLINHKNIDLNITTIYGDTILSYIINLSYTPKINYFYSITNTNNSQEHYTKDQSTYELLIKLLFEKNININILDVDGNFIIKPIIDYKNHTLFNLFINHKKFDINLKNSAGDTILMYIIKQLNDNITMPVINKINSNCKNGSVATCYDNISYDCTLNGTSDIINLRKTIDIGGNSFENIGGYSFENLGANNYSSIFENIGVNNGSNLLGNTYYNSSGNIDGNCKSNDNLFYINCITKLAKNINIDPNIQNIIGSSLMHILVNVKNIPTLKKMVEMFLKIKNISVNIQDYKGYTPIMYAIENNKWEIVSLLVNNNADINLTNNNGNNINELVKSEEHKYILSNIINNKINNKNIVINSDINKEVTKNNEEKTKSWFFK
jgi:ankyrin repeat protein